MKYVYRVEPNVGKSYTMRSDKEFAEFKKDEHWNEAIAPSRIWQREAGLNNPWKCVFDRERDERIRRFKSLT